MRIYSGVVVLVAIVLGIAAGGMAYFLYPNVSISIAAALAALFGTAGLLSRFSAA